MHHVRFKIFIIITLLAFTAVILFSLKLNREIAEKYENQKYNMQGLHTEIKKPQFISLNMTDSLIQGESHTIKWNMPLPYDSHCANIIMAVNVNTNESFIINLPEKDSTEFVWDARTGTDGSCGTGNNPVEIQPGTYKLILKEEDTSFGVGKTVEFESEPFSIVVNQKELDQYYSLIPKIKSYYKNVIEDDIHISQKLKLPDDQDMLLVQVGQGPAVSESTLFLLKDTSVEHINVQEKDGKKSPVSLLWGASGNYSFGDRYSSLQHSIIKVYREFKYADGDIDGKAILTKCEISAYVWDSEKNLFLYNENSTNYQRSLECK